MNPIPSLFSFVVMALGLLLALLIGTAIGSEDYLLILFWTGGPTLVTWMVLARERWWLPLVVGAASGGAFQIPFKIYPVELALALALIGVIPQIALKPRGLMQRRGRPPAVFLILLAYLLVHLGYSGLFHRTPDGGGLGNIARSYSMGLWALGAGLLIYYYGSMARQRTVVRLLMAALIVRVALGFGSFILDEPIIIPGINYIIQQWDLRYSGPLLMVLSGFLLVTRVSLPVKTFYALLILVGLVAVVSGGSRGTTAYALAAPFIIGALFRRWLLTGAYGGLALCAILAVNFYPQTLELLPSRLERGSSFVILGERSQIRVQDEVAGSNTFHQRLNEEGYTRWTTDGSSLVFGVGVRPFDEQYIMGASRFEMDPFTLMVKVAADVGSYENSFWTMLAVTGLVGLGLYLTLLTFLFVPIWKALGPRKYPPDAFPLISLAGFLIASWYLFMPIFGHFPSQEVFFGLLAYLTLQDFAGQRSETTPAKDSSSLSRGPALPALEPVGAARAQRGAIPKTPAHRRLPMRSAPPRVS